MCSVYYNGMYDTMRVKLPLRVYKKSQIIDEANTLGISELLLNSDLIAKDIEYSSRKFKVNDLVAIKRDERDTLEVGLIKVIFVRGGDVYFIIVSI